MKCRYETRLNALCPVNGQPDCYDVIVESDKMIMVEHLNEVVGFYAGSKDFQEDLTHELARKLGATVTTIGYHYGVKTTCTC